MPREDSEAITAYLRELEKETIKQALSETSSISEAAKILGIPRGILYRKMKKIGAKI